MANLSSYYDGVPVGGIVQANGVIPLNSANYLLCDGSTYLSSSYPNISSSMIQPFNFSNATLPTSQVWVSAAWDSNLAIWVAVGGTSSTAGGSSTNGTSWTARTLPSATWTSCCSNNAGTFVAIASGTTSAASSTNGTSWTSRTLPLALPWTNVVWNGTYFVAACTSSGLPFVITSTDGLTWVTKSCVTSISSVSITRLAANPSTGQIIVITSSFQSFSSTDAVAWTPMLPTSGSLSTGCAYWNGSIWWLGSSNLPYFAWTSTDGRLWYPQYQPESNQMSSNDGPNGQAGCAVGSTFVVVGSSGNGVKAVHYSTDGIFWCSQRGSLPQAFSTPNFAATDGTNILVTGNGATTAAAYGVPDTTHFMVPRLNHAGNFYLRYA